MVDRNSDQTKRLGRKLGALESVNGASTSITVRLSTFTAVERQRWRSGYRENCGSEASRRPPAAPDSPSATPVVISGPLFLRRLLLPTLRQYRYDFNINSQLEHLQAKYVGTGHADLSRLEWAVNIKRDSYASYIGHYPMLAYFAIAENESIGRERYNFMQ
ncbi:hypothetical protein YC2023_112615 [Brassica napus]